MTTSDVAAEGVLPVDKPVGPTSHDVVDLARRALQVRRIGHTGTLDPFASGLLLLCVGGATRAAEYLSGLDKRYHAAVRLGVTTDTDDHTGAVIASADAHRVTREEVEAVLARLRGEVLQTPPQYSAKKRGGERAYAAARQGRAVELEPVRVRIGELMLTAFDPPDLELNLVCSSGTYVRAVARDLGAALGVGAHLTGLRRTGIGPHDVAGALTPDALADPARVAAAVMPLRVALAHLPAHELDEDEAGAIRHGRAIRAGADTPDAAVVLLCIGPEVVAIGERSAGMVRPRKVLR
jgi:tRNA pseudouridine55 synthase